MSNKHTPGQPGARSADLQSAYRVKQESGGARYDKPIINRRSA